MAKQKEDKKTLDLYGEPAARGRPRVYQDNAAKQRAYRLRQKAAALPSSATADPAPLVT